MYICALKCNTRHSKERKIPSLSMLEKCERRSVKANGNSCLEAIKREDCKKEANKALLVMILDVSFVAERRMSLVLPTTTTTTIISSICH